MNFNFFRSKPRPIPEDQPRHKVEDGRIFFWGDEARSFWKEDVLNVTYRQELDVMFDFQYLIFSTTIGEFQFDESAPGFQDVWNQMAEWFPEVREGKPFEPLTTAEKQIYPK